MRIFKMKQQRIDNSFETVKGHSKTVPSEVISIREMLTRFASGRDVKIDTRRQGDYYPELMQDANMEHKVDLAARTLEASKEYEKAQIKEKRETDKKEQEQIQDKIQKEDKPEKEQKEKQSE